MNLIAAPELRASDWLNVEGQPAKTAPELTQEKTMSAFFFFDNVEVHDPAKLAEYAEKVAPIVDRYGGKYRVVGGAAKVLEGQWKPAYPVLIEFESVERAEAWYRSEDYEPLKRLRRSAVTNTGVLIEGLAEQ